MEKGLPIKRPAFLSRPHVWCFTTYFAEGLPYTLIRTVSSVFFRDMRVSLESIGLTSLYSIPWILKFLWAPFIDQFGSRRQWILLMEGALLALFLFASFSVAASWGIQAIAVLFLAGAVLAATQDVAVDGYYMEGLDNAGIAKFLGYRVMAYRVAMMTGTGLIVTCGAAWGWASAFRLAGALMGLLLVYHLLFLPRVGNIVQTLPRLVTSLANPSRVLGILALFLTIYGMRSLLVSQWYTSAIGHVPFLKQMTFASWVALVLLLAILILALMRGKIQRSLLSKPDSFYTRAFLSFAAKEHIVLFIWTVIFLRAGEALLAAMVSPFMVDLGLKSHFGWVTGMVGLPCSIAGAMLGGAMISRFTLKKVLWPFLLAQNLTNIIYMLLALSFNTLLARNIAAPLSMQIPSMGGIAVVALINGFDQFSGGLGMAVLITLTLRTVSGENRTSHVAIWTGLTNVSGLLAGMLSGFLATWVGYGYFFGLSFVASVPGMILLVMLSRKVDFERMGQESEVHDVVPVSGHRATGIPAKTGKSL